MDKSLFTSPSTGDRDSLPWSEWKRRRAVCRRVMAKIAKQAVALAFSSWAGHKAAMQEQRVMLQRVVGRLTMAAAARAFGGWCELLRQRAACQKILMRLANRAVGAAFV